MKETPFNLITFMHSIEQIIPRIIKRTFPIDIFSKKPDKRRRRRRRSLELSKERIVRKTSKFLWPILPFGSWLSAELTTRRTSSRANTFLCSEKIRFAGVINQTLQPFGSARASGHRSQVVFHDLTTVGTVAGHTVGYRSCHNEVSFRLIIIHVIYEL